MRLADLLPEYSVPKSHADLTIFGVADDSREVRFGFVFCALPLANGTGLHYCAQAAARGAQVVIVPDGTPDAALGLTDFEKSKVVVLRHPKIQTLYAQLVARFHGGHPSTMVAVTGTNGKSATVSFLRDIWTHAGRADNQAVEVDLRDVQVSVVSELARNYFELRGAQWQLAVAERSLTNQRETLRLTQLRRDAGVGEEQDVASAAARVAAIEASIPLNLKRGARNSICPC